MLNLEQWFFIGCCRSGSGSVSTRRLLLWQWLFLLLCRLWLERRIRYNLLLWLRLGLLGLLRRYNPHISSPGRYLLREESLLVQRLLLGFRQRHREYLAAGQSERLLLGWEWLRLLALLHHRELWNLLWLLWLLWLLRELYLRLCWELRDLLLLKIWRVRLCR